MVSANFAAPVKRRGRPPQSPSAAVHGQDRSGKTGILRTFVHVGRVTSDYSVWNTDLRPRQTRFRLKRLHAHEREQFPTKSKLISRSLLMDGIGAGSRG